MLGRVVLHTCDNRRCWNPEHLVLGSYSDNMMDVYAKGRRPSRPKLSAADRWFRDQVIARMQVQSVER